MHVAASESTTAISWPHMKSIAGWEDNREDSKRKGQTLTCERSKEELRCTRSEQEHTRQSSEEARGPQSRGEEPRQDVSHQPARRAEGGRPQAQGWLGRHAGAVPDRQEVRRRRPCGRLDRSETRCTA